MRQDLHRFQPLALLRVHPFKGLVQRRPRRSHQCVVPCSTLFVGQGHERVVVARLQAEVLDGVARGACCTRFGHQLECGRQGLPQQEFLGVQVEKAALCPRPASAALVLCHYGILGSRVI